MIIHYIKLSRDRRLHTHHPPLVRPRPSQTSERSPVVPYDSGVKSGGFSVSYDWRTVCLHFPLLHCVLAVTLASPPPPWLIRIHSTLLSPSLLFPPYPLLFCLSHIPVQPAAVGKEPDRSETVQHSASAHTLIVGPLCKNVNTMRTQSKNVHIRHGDVRKTK